jgi:hypothetical protein
MEGESNGMSDLMAATRKLHRAAPRQTLRFARLWLGVTTWCGI